jgi:hypothetical protein
MFDPNYKIKHKPPFPERLRRYTGRQLPPPMVGDPRGNFRAWGVRCEVIYAHMMSLKMPPKPKPKTAGLWFYAEPLGKQHCHNP